jgi:hypothetical protein
MKQFSHAWLAFKAIERLEKADLKNYRQDADGLIRWLWDHRDGLIQGAWYPDMVFKDMATSHVLKFTPDPQGKKDLLGLPQDSQYLAVGKKSALYGQPYRVDPGTNLPVRCEAMAHSIIDNFKMQETEEKGSPISPTDNHIANRLFILSHYVADAHMPLHCDSRPFSGGKDLHAQIEGVWDDEIEKHFELDRLNDRFTYGSDGYPLRKKTDYSASFLKQVDDGLSARPFGIEYGGNNTSIEDYMRAVCQYSYLVAYAFIPPQYDPNTIDMNQWQSLPGGVIDFNTLSPLVFSEAIDAIARIWLRVWRRYTAWLKG